MTYKCPIEGDEEFYVDQLKINFVWLKMAVFKF